MVTVRVLMQGVETKFTANTFTYYDHGYAFNNVVFPDGSKCSKMYTPTWFTVIRVDGENE